MGLRVLILGGDRYLGWPTDPAFSRQGHRVALVDKLRQAATIVRHRTSSGTCSAERERMISETSFRLTAKDYPWLLPLAVVGAVATGCKRAVTRRERWWLTTRLEGYRAAVKGPIPCETHLRSSGSWTICDSPVPSPAWCCLAPVCWTG